MIEMTQNIYEIAAQVGATLAARNLKLVTVESCTGGLIAATTTAISGSSAYFERGFVTYSNESKTELVGVPPETLQQHGAVSAATVQAMVEGGIQKSRAQVGIAVTGIAGPGGAASKPVGTVYFAWKILAAPTTVTCRHFDGDRAAVRTQATYYALQQLQQLLKDSTG